MYANCRLVFDPAAVVRAQVGDYGWLSGYFNDYSDGEAPDAEPLYGLAKLNKNYDYGPSV